MLCLYEMAYLINNFNSVIDIIRAIKIKMFNNLILLNTW